MDIEKLTKSQIVLLTLLVSFVTSIATGIVTVSLMDQAPPVIAQTVNRVIEHTVETVAPSVLGQGAAVIAPVQEMPVVIREAELIPKAVARVEPSLVRIQTSGSENVTTLGIGIVIDAQGTVMADAAALQERADAMLVLSDGTRVRAFVVERDTSDGVALLRATTTAETAPVQWSPARFASRSPALGQTVVLVSGGESTRISNGIVAAFLGDSEEVIDTSIAGAGILPGSPIIDLDGIIVGVSMAASRTSSPSGFSPATLLVGR